jgi:RNA polymerase sigma-B factor
LQSRTAIASPTPTPRRPSDQQLRRESRLLREHAKRPSEQTRNELLELFTPYANSFVRRYQTSSEETEDLAQVAAVGLINAIDRYEPGRGSFKGFAAPTILGELRHHMRDRVFSVRLPRRLQDTIMALSSASTELSEELGREPTVRELAARSGVALEDVVEALEAKNARNEISLNAPVDGEEGLQAIDTLSCLEGGYDFVEANLSAAGAHLSRREQRALRLYYGKGMTQSEIGDLIGVSQMQISRVLRGAVDKLLEVVRASEEGALDAPREDAADGTDPRRAKRMQVARRGTRGS